MREDRIADMMQWVSTLIDVTDRLSQVKSSLHLGASLAFIGSIKSNTG